MSASAHPVTFAERAAALREIAIHMRADWPEAREELCAIARELDEAATQMAEINNTLQECIALLRKEVEE